MSVPDFQTLMLPLLECAGAGVTRVRECVDAVAGRFSLTPDDLAERLPSGKQTVILNRLHWARTYLGKAGLLTATGRGVFEISPLGRDVLAERPQRIDMEFLERFEGYRAWRELDRGAGRAGPSPPRTRPPAGDESDGLTPDDRIERAAAELEAALADDLLAALLDGSPAFFEAAVVELLVAMGYGRGRDGAGQRLGRSGDGGVDGVINEDALGLDAVYVQAKRYAPENVIGRPAIQQFVGSLTGEGAAKGVFVTTSSFSREANAYVEKIAQRIVLIDGRRFTRLMIAHGVGVRPVRTITISRIDENFFVES